MKWCICKTDPPGVSMKRNRKKMCKKRPEKDLFEICQKRPIFCQKRQQGKCVKSDLVLTATCTIRFNKQQRDAPNSPMYTTDNVYVVIKKVRNDHDGSFQENFLSGCVKDFRAAYSSIYTHTHMHTHTHARATHTHTHTQTSCLIL